METDFFKRVRNDHPEFLFRKGRKFAFRPPKTIVVGPSEPNDSLLLLHELGHALCGHRDFTTDVLRIKMEREAWEKAHELAESYGILYDTGVVEEQLDTYRDWLDNKSRCPKCGLTRYQTSDQMYHCPRCENLT